MKPVDLSGCLIPFALMLSDGGGTLARSLVPVVLTEVVAGGALRKSSDALCTSSVFSRFRVSPALYDLHPVSVASQKSTWGHYALCLPCFNGKTVASGVYLWQSKLVHKLSGKHCLESRRRVLSHLTRLMAPL